MIGRLRGTIAAVDLDRIVLDVGGVGYEIGVTPRTLSFLPPLGDDAVVHTHLYVREDVLALFGFASTDERDLFRILITVSGIGPRMAMAMLGTMSPDELRIAVRSDDTAALTLVPGIGKRSAQKIILELRPRFDLPDTQIEPRSALGEVRLALEGLGYQPDEIRAAVASVPSDLPTAEMLRLVLKELGRTGGR